MTPIPTPAHPWSILRKTALGTWSCYGEGDPADGPEIEQRFKRAETALREFIDALIVKPS